MRNDLINKWIKEVNEEIKKAELIRDRVTRISRIAMLEVLKKQLITIRDGINSIYTLQSPIKTEAGVLMKSSKSLEILYKTFEEVEGKEAARETVSSILFNVIFDLQESGKEITSSAIERSLDYKINSIVRGQKKNAA